MSKTRQIAIFVLILIAIALGIIYYNGVKNTGNLNSLEEKSLLEEQDQLDKLFNQ